MNLYNQAFEEALDQNYVNEEKWTNYKNEVIETKSTVNEFLKSCQLDILVPLGKKAYVRGKLIHTNDILVSHNPNYFSLVSNAQVNEILESRLEKCDERLEAIEAERKLFQNKLDVSNKDVFSEQEIIEEYNEEVEAEWRRKHKESVKLQKMQEAKDRQSNSNTNIDELLDRFELLEEMANELDTLNDGGEVDDEMLSKFINGEIKVPESKKRIAHNLSDEEDDKQEECLDVKSTYILQKYKKNDEKFDEIVVECKKDEKKKKKKSVRFSSNDDVNEIVPAVEVIKNPTPTIEIKFKHSPGKFHPDPPDLLQKESEGEVPKFAHPGQLSSFIQSLTLSSKPETKSILKSKGGKKKSVKFNTTRHDQQDEKDDEFESFLRQQVIIGDVIEHKHDDPTVSNIPVEPIKKVSKFKEMRNLKMK